MTEKFTHGEWVILPISKSTADVPAFLVHERKFGEVAIVNFHGGSDGETEKANAALIAAAPDLFECVCDAMSDLQMSEGMRNHFEAVLKKARGEE